VGKRGDRISFSDHTPTRVLASILDDMADEGDRTISDRTLIDRVDRVDRTTVDRDDRAVAEPKPPVSDLAYAESDETKAGHYERVSLGKYKLTEGAAPPSSRAPESEAPRAPSSVAPVAMPASSSGPYDAAAGIERTTIALCATLLTTAALFGVIAAFVSTRSTDEHAAAAVSTSVLDAERAAAK
jgi:hypothetical protein